MMKVLNIDELNCCAGGGHNITHECFEMVFKTDVDAAVKELKDIIASHHPIRSACGKEMIKIIDDVFGCEKEGDKASDLLSFRSNPSPSQEPKMVRRCEHKECANYGRNEFYSIKSKIWTHLPSIALQEALDS